jgi:hypothetical protein
MMAGSHEAAADHGLHFEFHGDGVDLVDLAGPGQPRVRMSMAEYEAFHEGVLAGEFDLDVLRERSG